MRMKRTRIVISNGDVPKSPALYQPNYRFSRRLLVKSSKSIIHEIHLHKRADAARRLMTHVRDHTASTEESERETAPKTARNIVR